MFLMHLVGIIDDSDESLASNVDVDDRPQGLPYDFAVLCPTPAGGLPNDLAAFLFGLLHVFIHVIPPG